ncbi:MAG: hypothetical protein GY862_31680 [Gammaproteobacteria bacterium]|nr:hypothetical protein [Gammaproteobacteria bacterium]
MLNKLNILSQQGKFSHARLNRRPGRRTAPALSLMLAVLFLAPVVYTQAAEMPLPAPSSSSIKNKEEVKPESIVDKLVETTPELLRLKREKVEWELKNELQMEKNKYELAKLTAENERLELENTIFEQRQRRALAEMDAKKNVLALENELEELLNRKRELKETLETTRLEEKIAKRDKHREWDSEANNPPKYLIDPFENGVLTLSDRRIYLTGPILPGMADRISERINYFNNKHSEYPIFLVIDRCSGGSVMEGEQIIRSMQSSRAPVYVVVKSAAASMAAIITAVGKHSYAYPNALIGHHQIVNMFYGNATEVKDSLKITNQWSLRVMQPVATKMGITLDEFVKKMYEANTNGNWLVFGDEAKELRWIDTLVSEVVETGYIKKPSSEKKDESGEVASYKLKELRDEHGRPYAQLPHLMYGDFYSLYDPDGYYRR